MKNKTTQKGIAPLIIILIIAGVGFFTLQGSLNGNLLEKVGSFLVPKSELSNEDIQNIEDSTKANTQTSALSKILSLLPTPKPTPEPTFSPQKTTNCPNGQSYCADSKTLVMCFEDNGNTIQTTCTGGQGICDSSLNWCK